MKVILIIDSYGVDTEDALVVSKPNEIQETRARIREALINNSNEILRIKINSALYKRVSDLEGLPGIEVKHIFPKVQLAKILGDKVPEWLSEKFIIDFNLLQSPQLSENHNKIDNIAWKVLCLITEDFSNLESINDFYRIVENIHDSFSQLLQISEVYDLLSLKLQQLIKTSAINLLLDELKCSKSPQLTLNKIGSEQILENLKKFSYDHDFRNISFPARNYPSALLSELPIYNIQEDKAGATLSKLIEVLEHTDISIRNNEISPHHLSSIVVSWPSFIRRLSILLEDNTKLASNALVDSLKKYDSPDIDVLCRRIEELLRIGNCDRLDLSANVEEVLEWCRGYLDYSSHCFLHEHEPDENISYSFTKWLLQEKIRVQLSNSNWHSISSSIEEHLIHGRLVILCMVDALGAIHLDLLKQELDSNLEGICIDDRLIFSPLPTLTEVCKMPVITGQHAHLLSANNQESIIRKRYSKYLPSQDSLNIAQSWKDFRGSLTKNTKMLVCFENRIDERLHGCVNYQKHQKDVKLIVKSLIKDIHEWLIYGAVLNKEVVVIITADHGVSSINNKIDCDINGADSIGERVCRVEREPNHLPDDTCFISDNRKADSGYVVPTNRRRYSGHTSLVHGGLTAEEVMIPFLTLTKGIITGVTKPLELTIEHDECQIINDGWQIHLGLVTKDTLIQKIKISVNLPFKGSEGPIGPIHPHKKMSIRFLLRSDIEQSGLLNVSFIVSYVIEGDIESKQFTTTLQLRFPMSLLESDDGARVFDDMFD